MPETWSVPPRVLADAVDLRELVRLGQVNDGLAGKADAGHVHDARYVDFVSDQAIGGVKSFTTSGSPLVPAPTAPENPVRWGDRAPAGGTASNTLSVTQTYAIDATGAPVRYFTLTASPTLAVPSGGVNGQTIRLWLFGSGATRTFTFASGYDVSPQVPSRVISVAAGTWELVEIELRAGTWRLVSTDQLLFAAADVGAVPTSRAVGTGAGLSGGGALSADRTLALAFKGFRGRQSTATSMSATALTWTSIPLDTEIYDTDDAHSTTTNTARFTAVTAGYYDLSGVVAFASNGTGNRGARFTVNGTPVPGSVAYIHQGTAAVVAVPAHTSTVYLAAGAYAELQGVSSVASHATFVAGSPTDFASAMQAVFRGA